MTKYILAVALVLFCGNSVVKASEIGFGKTLECIEANKEIATNLLSSAAKNIGFTASEMTLLWNSDLHRLHL